MRHIVRVLTVVALLAAALAATVAPANAVLTVGTTQTFAVTTNGTTVAHDGNILGISCVPAVGGAAAGCMAVGTNEGTQHPLYAIGEPTLTPAYADAASGRHNLEDVSCLSSVSCIAVGWGDTNSTAGHPYIKEYSSGTWATPIADPPDIKLTAGNARLWNVECFDFNNCVAAGSYQATTGDAYWAFVATKVSGTWSAQRVTVSGETISTGPWWNGSKISDISCVSSTLCVGVGFFRNGSGQRQYFTAKGVLSSGAWTWTTSTISVPTATGYGEEPRVSCAPDGYCMMVAGFTSSGSNQYPLIALEFNNSAWSNTPIVFDDATNDGIWMGDVSCPVSGICYVTGGSITGNGYVWEFTDGVPVRVPVTKGSVGTWLGPIDCPTMNSCAVMGNANNGTGGNGFTFITVRENGTWIVNPSLSVAAQNTYDTQQMTIDCRVDGFCLAGGNDRVSAWKAAVTPFTFTVDPNNTRSGSGGGSGNGGGLGSGNGSGSGSGSGSGTVIDESGTLVTIPVFTG